MSGERLTALALAQASLAVVYGEDGCGRYGGGVELLERHRAGHVELHLEDSFVALAAAS